LYLLFIVTFICVNVLGYFDDYDMYSSSLTAKETGTPSGLTGQEKQEGYNSDTSVPAHFFVDGNLILSAYDAKDKSRRHTRNKKRRIEVNIGDIPIGVTPAWGSQFVRMPKPVTAACDMRIHTKSRND
jgi:hypothetical protein